MYSGDTCLVVPFFEFSADNFNVMDYHSTSRHPLKKMHIDCVMKGSQG